MREVQMGHEGLKTKVLWLELGSQALSIPGNLLGSPGLALVVPYFCPVLPHSHCIWGCCGDKRYHRVPENPKGFLWSHLVWGRGKLNRKWSCKWLRQVSISHS